MKKLLFLVLISFFLGCDFLEEKGSVLVQVGESCLTLQKIQGKVPGWDSLSVEQQSEFLKTWVDEELLYQAALQQKLDKRQDVASTIERAKRKIVIDYLVNELTDSITLSEKEVEKFYEENTDKFLYGKHLYSLAILSYPSWNLGDLYFRGKKNTRFDRAPSADYRVRKIESFEMVTESPDSCLVEDLRSLQLGVLTNFKVCGNALKSVVLYAKEDSAATRPFENVKEEAAVLLRLEKRKQLMEKFRAEQKKKIAVFADWNPSATP
jgi:hypothetical protein